jgi:predicted amidophosphoribosyltransferase
MRMIELDGYQIDEGGNPFDPETCPCCQGALTYDPNALCDACLVAGLEARYPHGCARDAS